jgi:GNAT superfamily N-acetyltransferase
MNIIDVNKENVSETGFFCYMSKRRSDGYGRKLRWLQEGFNEGLKMKMLDLQLGGRGFIEYMPGESAWRAVNAEGYMVIHCIWVAGQSKGKGYATLLLRECLEDARKLQMKGVAVLTSEGNWLVGHRFFLKHGFEPVDEYTPFKLMVRKFGAFPSPSLSGAFADKLRRCGEGLTIVRSDQCPYVNAAAEAARQAGETLGIKTKVIELRDSEDVRELSPSPYGVFAVVHDGTLLTYHSMSKQDLMTILGNG